jgi:fumarate hydratase, class II
MNANEVIASLATRGLKAASARQRPRQPGPELQRRGSHRDPGRGGAGLREDLLPALEHLRKTIDRRAKAWASVVKTGRTHLMDAMPLTFGQELGAGRRSWPRRANASRTA